MKEKSKCTAMSREPSVLQELG